MRQMFIIVIIAISFAVSAKTLLLHDGELTWQASTGRMCNIPYKWPSNNCNMTSPDDYISGDFCIRIEILEKPTTRGMRMHGIVIWNDGENTWSKDDIKFANKGDIAYAKRSPKAFWMKGGKLANWSNCSGKRCPIIIDGAVNKWMANCSGSHCLGSEANKHMPIKMRYTLFAVSKGDNLTVPESMDFFKCPAAWNCKGGGAVSTANKRNQLSAVQTLSWSCTKNEILIDIPMAGASDITLCDMSGRMVHSEKVDGRSCIGLDRNILGAGMYVIKVSGHNPVSSRLYVP